MAKVKKSPEEKLAGQIDRLVKKNTDDNSLCERLTMENSKISQSVIHRKRYLETCDLIEGIAKSIQRRSRALRKKGEKLSELRTENLGITP